MRVCLAVPPDLGVSACRDEQFYWGPLVANVKPPGGFTGSRRAMSACVVPQLDAALINCCCIYATGGHGYPAGTQYPIV
jgi:hypothetical protein